MPSPPPSLIGPMVGAAGAGSVRIVLGQPFGDSPALRCRLELEDGSRRELEVEPSHGRYRSFVFPFDGLPEGAACRYSVLTPDGPLDLEGLVAEDCRFRVPGAFGPDDSFLLTSCHRPDDEIIEERGDRSCLPWRTLRERLDGDDGIRLLVLAGDQLYNDVVKAGLDEGEADDLEGRLAENYLRSWGELDYRRALARLPSVAMWDDHDITDGWGSRLEQFSGDEIREDWMDYFRAARSAAAAYQFARNPAPLLPGADAPFTTRLDLGPVRLLLLDLRSERNARKTQLWSVAHERAALSAIEEAPGSLFVSTSVVAFRTNPGRDSRLGAISSALLRLARWWEQRGWLRGLWAAGLSVLLAGALIAWPPALVCWVLLGPWLLAGLIPESIHAIPILPHLTDDLEDGLSSPANRVTLRRLLDALLARSEPVTLLGGDVHLQGLAELVDARKSPRRSILQVVSSPITNLPMRKVVAGLTTTTSPIRLDEENAGLSARNVAWFSKRGFAQVRPAGFAEGAVGPAVLFHLEGHEEPLAFPASFLAPSR